MIFFVYALSSTWKMVQDECFGCVFRLILMAFLFYYSDGSIEPKRYGFKKSARGTAPPLTNGASTIKVCFYWKAGRCTRHPCPFLHGEPQHPNVGSMRKRIVAPDHLVTPVDKSHQGTGCVWRNPNAGSKPSAPYPKGVCMMNLESNVKFPAAAVDHSVSTPMEACDRIVEINGKTCTVATKKGSGEIKPNTNSKPNVISSKGVCKINQHSNARAPAMAVNRYACSVEEVCGSNLESNAETPAAAAKKGSEEMNEGEVRPCGNTIAVICKRYFSGNCSYGESCRDRHSWCISDSFSLLARLEGHSKVTFNGFNLRNSSVLMLSLFFFLLLLL